MCQSYVDFRRQIGQQQKKPDSSIRLVYIQIIHRTFLKCRKCTPNYESLCKLNCNVQRALSNTKYTIKGPGHVLALPNDAVRNLPSKKQRIIKRNLENTFVGWLGRNA